MENSKQSFPGLFKHTLENIEFHPIQQKDLMDVTDIHLKAFPERALAGLGREAVCRYYQWQVEGPHDAVALGCFRQNKMVGYCFAGIFRGSLSGFLHKNKWFLARRVLIHPWLITSPLFRERIMTAWRILFHRSNKVAPQIMLPQKSFGILAIAIDPQIQRAGLGGKLMAEMERIAKHHGFTYMHLTVDSQNSSAIAFYNKLGWHEHHATDGVWYGTMTKCLERDDD